MDDNKLKIGYATGVFDLFHIGHLNLLKKAKSQCTYLIVGVTTDELTFSLKNRRPVIPFEERLEIVKNIKFVDEVVPEKTNDKIAAWKDLNFHVIFKGDDWKGTEKWNKLEEEFSKLDVEVVYFEYTKNTSSTKLLNIINKLEKEL